MRNRFATILGLVVGLAGSAQAGVLQAPTDNTGSGGSDLTGYTVVYIFTGVLDVTTEAAVSIHCTNVGKVDTTFAVEIFDEHAAFVRDHLMGIAREESKTVSTRATLFGESFVATGEITRIGSGRILVADRKASLLCGAQLVEPDNGGAPSYLSPLPIVPVGKALKPKILKN